MITENCTYSAPLNGQGLTPVATEPFQFSVRSCEQVGTSTVNVDFTNLVVAQGFMLAFASMVLVIWLFKKN